MSGTGQQEKEFKFSGADHQALRRHLKNMDAELVTPAGFEDNEIFDQRGDLAQRGCLLRLRKDRKGWRLTFKGPARFDGGLKIRPEYETAVENGKAIEEILQALGFRRVRRYQKLREEWLVNDVVVALDRTPIGDFAEFEGERAGEVALQCGLEPAEAERRSYLRIYEDYRQEHPDSPEDMVFQ